MGASVVLKLLGLDELTPMMTEISEQAAKVAKSFTSMGASASGADAAMDTAAESMVASVDQLAAAQARASISTADLADAQARVADSAANLAAANAAAADEVDGALDQQRAALAAYTAACAQADVAAKSLADSQKMLADSSEESAVKQDEAAGASEESGGLMAALSSPYGMAAAAIAAVGAVSLKMAIDFQSSTAQVAASAGISVAAAGRITTAFLNTAGETTFSSQQVASAYASVAGQLGLLVGHALNASQAMTVMKASEDLAEASGTSLASATGDVSKVLTGFQMSITQAAAASDVLYNSSRLTNTSVDSVTQTFTKLRTTLGAAAPPLSQMGGLFVDLQAHGMQGRAALSAVGTVINGLMAPTTAASKEMTKLGISFQDAEGNFVGVGPALGILQKALAGMPAPAAAAELKLLGLGTAGEKLLPTIQSGAGAFDQYTLGVSKTGSASDAASKNSDTLKGSLEKIRNSVETLFTKIGQALLPTITKLAASVAKAAATVTKWIGTHQKLIASIEHVVALIAGGLAKSIGTVIGLIIKIATVVDDAAKKFAPLKIALIAIAAAIVLVTMPFLVLGAAVGYVSEHWKSLVDDFKRGLSEIGSFFSSVFSGIESMGKHVIDSIVQFVESLPGKILSSIESIGKSWLHMWQTVLDFITGLPGKILELVAGFGSLLISAGKDLVKGLIHGIEGMFGALGSAVASLASHVLGPLGGLLHLFSPSKKTMEMGKQVVAGMAIGITNSLGVAEQASRLMGQKVLDAAGAAASGAALSASVSSSMSHSFSAASVSSTALAGGSSAPGGITIDLRGSHVMGTNAIKQLTDQIGGVLVKRGVTNRGAKVRS